MIHRPDEFTENFEVETDVVIVGAGPGGAAAAHKLSLLGRKVILLESGGYYTPGDFTRDGVKALKNLYQDGGSRFSRNAIPFQLLYASAQIGAQRSGSYPPVKSTTLSAVTR